MKSNVQNFLFGLCFFLISTTVSALPFNIVPKTGTTLPTAIHPDIATTATAYYTVTNNTQQSSANNYVKYLPPNVTQVTSGGTYGDTCGATFTLAANASCTLQLTISGSVNASDPDPHHHLFVCFPGGITCAGTSSPLNVIYSNSPLASITVSPSNASIDIGFTQQYTATANYADQSTADITSFVTWSSSSPGAATITSHGLSSGVATGNSTITASWNSFVSNAVSLRVKTMVYVTSDVGNTVYACTIKSDGSINSCQANNDPTFNYNSGIGLNPDSTLAYVLNRGSNTVSYCPLNSINGLLGICYDAGGSGFNQPVTIVFDRVSGNAYILNFLNQSTVIYCTVNSNGSFSECSLAGSFNRGSDMTITPNGMNAYILEVDPSAIRHCSITHEGSLSNCVTTASEVTGAVGITINPAGTYAYITQQNAQSVSYCAINSSTGDLDNCVVTKTGLLYPIGIAISPAGTFAYIAGLYTRSIYVCSIQPNGSFGACTTYAVPTPSDQQLVTLVIS